jgi:hypothetical protein
MSDHTMRKTMTINTRQAHRKATCQIPQESNTQKQVVRLENHIVTLVMRHEQPESISHVFSKPPSNTYMGPEEVEGSVLA